MLHDLKLVMPAPEFPYEGRGHDWEAVEQRLGTTLPDDYKAFIDSYGPGRIDRFIWIFNPFSANKNINLLDQVESLTDVLETLRQGGEVIPCEAFPAPGGILPFGMTDNGDVLYLVAAGEPCNWTVVVCDSRAPDWERFDMSMSAFLFAVLTRKIRCSIFPEDFPGPCAHFSGARP